MALLCRADDNFLELFLCFHEVGLLELFLCFHKVGPWGGSNSNCQAERQAPLPAEPSLWPMLGFLKDRFLSSVCSSHCQAPKHPICVRACSQHSTTLKWFCPHHPSAHEGSTVISVSCLLMGKWSLTHLTHHRKWLAPPALHSEVFAQWMAEK